MAHSSDTMTHISDTMTHSHDTMTHINITIFSVKCHLDKMANQTCPLSLLVLPPVYSSAVEYYDNGAYPMIFVIEKWSQLLLYMK